MLRGMGLVGHTREKVDANGLLRAFIGQRTMVYLKGDFAYGKQKSPSSVFAEGANSKKYFFLLAPFGAGPRFFFGFC